MRPGGGKAKGATFERGVCRLLSLWVSHGKNEDIFWRSAMSGGRATVARKKGLKLSRQAGDISAIAPEGHVLTNHYYFELKHVKDLGLLNLITKNTGPLADFWQVAKKEARFHNREPVLIAQQNRLPTIWVSRSGEPSLLAKFNRSVKRMKMLGGDLEIWLFDDILAAKFEPDADLLE